MLRKGGRKKGSKEGRKERRKKRWEGKKGKIKGREPISYPAVTTGELKVLKHFSMPFLLREKHTHKGDFKQKQLSITFTPSL